jgi:uncharacterized protein YkwD
LIVRDDTTLRLATTVLGVLHTKFFVGGLLVAATTIGGVVATEAAGQIGRAATASTRAQRLDAPEAAPSDQRGIHEVVELANVERQRRGLAPLTWHDQVAAAALVHTADMAARGVMSHTGSDGSNAGDRLRRAGFAWTAWGENIAAGFDAGAAVFDAWMASPGHRSQILGNFTYVGVAAVASPSGTPYWTMDFAS